MFSTEIAHSCPGIPGLDHRAPEILVDTEAKIAIRYRLLQNMRQTTLPISEPWYSHAGCYSTWWSTLTQVMPDLWR